LVKLVYPAGAPGVLTNVNFVSGDYTETGPNGGLLGDGSTKYLNSGFNAATDLPDNAHLSFYLREDVAATGNRGLLGAWAASDHYWLGALTPAAAVNARLGQIATAASAAALSKGFHLASRTAANQLKLYKNGAVAGSDAAAVTHAKPNTTVLVFALMANGSAASYLPARGSFYSIGQGLDEAEAMALHLAVRTLQRNLNRDIN
jgi:hypothetical protein